MASIDTVLVGTSGDVAIEHAVDHHGAEVGVLAIRLRSIAGKGVAAHYSRSEVGGLNIGIAKAVDHARVVAQAANQATRAVARSGNTWMSTFGKVGIVGQDTAVVDAAVACGDIGDRTHSVSCTADGNTFKHHILHHTAIDGVEQGMLEPGEGLEIAVEVA